MSEECYRTSCNIVNLGLSEGPGERMVRVGTSGVRSVGPEERQGTCPSRTRDKFGSVNDTDSGLTRGDPRRMLSENSGTYVAESSVPWRGSSGGIDLFCTGVGVRDRMSGHVKEES